jgi:hypothetical protein
MRRPSLAVMLLVAQAHAAFADPPADGIRARTDESEEPNDVPRVPPLLEHARTTRLTIDVATDGKMSRLPIGPVALTLGGEWVAPSPDLELSPIRVRAWRVGAGLAYATRWGTLHAGVDLDHLDSELGRSDLVSYGVGITRWFHLFGLRWYADLSLGRRRWIGDVPGGEFDDTAVMLRIGFHWR